RLHNVNLERADLSFKRAEQWRPIGHAEAPDHRHSTYLTDEHLPGIEYRLHWIEELVKCVALHGMELLFVSEGLVEEVPEYLQVLVPSCYLAAVAAAGPVSISRRLLSRTGAAAPRALPKHLAASGSQARGTPQRAIRSSSRFQLVKFFPKSFAN